MSGRRSKRDEDSNAYRRPKPAADRRLFDTGQRRTHDPFGDQYTEARTEDPDPTLGSEPTHGRLTPPCTCADANFEAEGVVDKETIAQLQAQIETQNLRLLANEEQIADLSQQSLDTQWAESGQAEMTEQISDVNARAYRLEQALLGFYLDRYRLSLQPSANASSANASFKLLSQKHRKKMAAAPAEPESERASDIGFASFVSNHGGQALSDLITDDQLKEYFNSEIGVEEVKETMSAGQGMQPTSSGLSWAGAVKGR